MTSTRRGSRRWLLALFAAVSLLLAGCGGGVQGAETTSQNGRASGRDATLTVFAAASLTDAFTELADRFEQRTGATVRTTFAGSSTLATQIVRGAPADVYASADSEQMRRVQQEGLATLGPKTFVRNKEVLVVPDENPAGIERLRDLREPGVRLVLAADDVPAAEYAEQILENAESRYGTKFQQRVLDNLVSREADVRAAVNRVATGDADATFGYASDITPDIRDHVKVIEIPPDLNVAATYPITVVRPDGSRAAKGKEGDKELARQWTTFVLSETGQQVLQKCGFQPVDG